MQEENNSSLPAAESRPDLQPPSIRQQIVTLCVQYAEDLRQRCVVEYAIIGLRYLDDNTIAEHSLFPAGQFAFRPGLEDRVERTRQLVPLASTEQDQTGSRTGPEREQISNRTGPAGPGRRLCDTEEEIMEILATAERPMPQKRIAARMGRRKANSWIKECFRRLQEDRLIRRVRGGYWRTDRQLPGEAA